jgi:hypothetical protein
MLSHAVMSVIQVLHLHDVEFGLSYCWELVFHLSWCEVTMVRIDAVVCARLELVEMVGFHTVMWIVILEPSKDWVLGVDTPGQLVPPCVRYGMACLLITDDVGSVPCSDEWKIGVVTCPGSHSARGAVVARLPWETLAMLWYCILPWQSLAYDL